MYSVKSSEEDYSPIAEESGESGSFTEVQYVDRLKQICDQHIQFLREVDEHINKL